MRLSAIASLLLLAAPALAAQHIDNWQMQDVVKTSPNGKEVSLATFDTQGWYKATVPGTVLTTLVDNGVYPEPLYGENMRSIPESLNKTSYWYRATLHIPRTTADRRTWLHFGGINYSSEVWINGNRIGETRGAFIRGDFDITAAVTPGKDATLAVLVSPQPHPGVPHEHTIELGEGKNGGVTAIDGPTFLSTIGWDWLPAVRDRDTGIWLPVTLSTSGPVLVKDPYITTDLASSHKSADITITTQLTNTKAAAVTGTLTGTITTATGTPITFRRAVTVPASGSQTVTLSSKEAAALHIADPELWWPNGYGPQNLYKLTLTFKDSAGKASDAQTAQFGIRKIEYEVPDNENLIIVVNGVRVMARGGNWGLDEGLKRIPRERLDAQFHMHAQANLNFIRNWVGQSTSPDFYDLADKYGILLWDEFFQPNPSDGPNPTDIPTYLANVQDKVLRFRNHPSIAVWCARNEGFPPKDLDDQLKAMMQQLDPARHYQSSSTDGRGVRSHGPYKWRTPREFFDANDPFKTEIGSVSVPTIESIRGMMPQQDWEIINDDWAQHDMTHGAQNGTAYPLQLAARYGEPRNLADFTRKAQLMNFEAFRAMYEGRSAKMFQPLTGVITWMSHPAQPSFVWQLYHYDLEPNSSLFAVRSASEHIHVQLNEATGQIQVINNASEAIAAAQITVDILDLSGTSLAHRTISVPQVKASTAADIEALTPPPSYSGVYFVRLKLTDSKGSDLSSNFYWQTTRQDDFTALASIAPATLSITAQPAPQPKAAQATSRSRLNTTITLKLTNTSSVPALMAHLQLRQKNSGKRVLPVFYSDNYISLLPNETRTVTITAATKDLDGDQPLIAVDGFNTSITNTSTNGSAITSNTDADPTLHPQTDMLRIVRAYEAKHPSRK